VIVVYIGILRLYLRQYLGIENHQLYEINKSFLDGEKNPEECQRAREETLNVIIKTLDAIM